nr:RNA-directed DNA polymerase, eukaryota [Tanacetum cinerariifolium]
MMRQNKNLMDINIDALYNILKQNQGDVNDAMGSKKKTVVVTSDPLALIAEKTNVSRSKEKVVVSSDSEGRHFVKDCKKVKVKDYEYYKIKMLLAKKVKDEQVLLAEDQSWMESSSDSDQEIIANMVFMAQIEKVLSDSEASSSSADEKISEVGTVADVYIAKRKKKFGQMFAFCRYIKVVNIENLISSLSNIWVGKLRLHANVARFDRKMDGKPSYAGVKVKPPVVTRNSHPPGNKTTSYANVAKASCDVGNKGSVCVDKECGDQTQVINIPMSSSQDIPLAVLGYSKDFCSIANARSLCHSEGFLDVHFKYLGGLWLLFEFNSLEARNSFLKHDGIRSWFSSLKPWHNDFTMDERLICLEIEGVPIRAWEDDLVFATIFMTLMNVTYAIRVCELCSWTPTFVEIDSDREDEEMQSNDGTDVVSVSGLSIDVNGEVQINADDIHDQAEKLTYLVGTEAASQSSGTPMFPPGFSPLPDDDVAGHSNAHHCIKPPDLESLHSSHGVNNKQIGFSMLERLEETIKIGTALGLNMEGCENTLATLIANNGEFKIMWIAVYASQALQDKIALWSSISNLSRNWDVILIALDDFNMAREAGVRFGSTFNERHANIFNAFISNSSLIDVPLGGYKFTWTNK